MRGDIVAAACRALAEYSDEVESAWRHAIWPVDARRHSARRRENHDYELRVWIQRLIALFALSACGTVRWSGSALAAPNHGHSGRDCDGWGDRRSTLESQDIAYVWVSPPYPASKASAVRTEAASNERTFTFWFSDRYRVLFAIIHHVFARTRRVP